MPPSAIQFMVIFFGLVLAYKFFITGFTFTWIPLGWFVADSMPADDLAVYVWLTFLLIYVFVVLRNDDAKHSRKDLQRP